MENRIFGAGSRSKEAVDDTWDSEGPSRVGQLTSSWSMTSTEVFLGSEYSKVQVYFRFESSNKLQWRGVECGEREQVLAFQ